MVPAPPQMGSLSQLQDQLNSAVGGLVGAPGMGGVDAVMLMQHAQQHMQQMQQQHNMQLQGQGGELQHMGVMGSEAHPLLSVLPLGDTLDHTHTLEHGAGGPQQHTLHDHAQVQQHGMQDHTQGMEHVQQQDHMQGMEHVQQQDHMQGMEHVQQQQGHTQGMEHVQHVQQQGLHDHLQGSMEHVQQQQQDQMQGMEQQQQDQQQQQIMEHMQQQQQIMEQAQQQQQMEVPLEHTHLMGGGKPADSQQLDPPLGLIDQEHVQLLGMPQQ